MTAAVAPAQDAFVSVASDLLGALTIPAHEVIRFPAGLYGFPECRAFALLPAAREGLFWLQSTDYGALTFLLADPFAWFPAYHIDLDDADISHLGSSDPQDILVLAIVTMPAARGEPCTANLHAPILFNLKERHAHQSIRTDESYGIREPFHLDQPAGDAAAPSA